MFRRNYTNDKVKITEIQKNQLGVDVGKNEDETSDESHEGGYEGDADDEEKKRVEML